MLRSQPERKYNNNNSEENSKKYKQQRNYCEKLVLITKMEDFQNFSNVNDDKIFWKTL